MLPGAYLFRIANLRTARSLASRNMSSAPPARTLMLSSLLSRLLAKSRNVLRCVRCGVLEGYRQPTCDSWHSLRLALSPPRLIATSDKTHVWAQPGLHLRRLLVSTVPGQLGSSGRKIRLLGAGRAAPRNG